MVNNELMGFNTLLHVTNLAPNVVMNSLYYRIDPLSNPLNHLITRWEDFTHKSLISRLDGHALVEMTDMLYWVCLPIVYNKCKLDKVVR